MSNKKEFILTSYSSWVIQSIFYSPKPCRSALSFAEPLTQRRPTFSPGNKATGCETGNSTSHIAKVKDYLSSNSNPPVDLQDVERDKFNHFNCVRKLSSQNYDVTYLKHFLSTLYKKPIYRVSTNSFPDCKHLLQENYVEYKQEHMLKCTNML